MAIAKTPAKKKKVSAAKKFCSGIIRKEGLGADRKLKPGYRYLDGGKIVKAKPAAKKKPTARKPTSKKKPARKPAANKK